MDLRRVIGMFATVIGLAVVGVAIAPFVSGRFDSPVYAQGLAQREQSRDRAVTMLAGRGAEIGVSVRDVEKADADRQHVTGGAVIEEVRPDTPAEKAGLKKSDVIVEFDGEHVRSARQFARLVQETAPGHEIKTTFVREGQRKDAQLTPSEGRGMTLFMDGNRPSDRSGDFSFAMPDLNALTNRMRGFNLDIPSVVSGRRLGVTVEELTSQLATYFGAKDGLLVTAVTDGTPASRAGIKAGDVVTSINGASVRSRDDLIRGLRDASSDDISIGIVRDKKDSTVKATIESPRRAPRGRPA